MKRPGVRGITIVAVCLALTAGGAQSRVTDSAPPIKIGLLADCSGFYGAFGDFAFAGAELALIQQRARTAGPSPRDGVSGAALLGHPIRIFLGCADGSPASALEQARRLVETVGVGILIGPLNGDEELALQGYARRWPAIAFVNGSAALQLRHPAPNFFSFHADGAQWDAGLGSYAFHTLGWRRVVTITDVHDAFNWAQTAGFDAEFCSLGGTITKRIGVPSGTQDLSSVATAVPRRGVDGLFVASASNVTGALMAADPALSRHLATRLLTGIFALPGTVHGARIHGFVYADTSSPAGGRYGSYVKALRTAFPHLDMGFEAVFDQDYYGAMLAALAALRVAHGDLAHGERAFLGALARVHLVTPQGPVRLDADHQAIVTISLRKVTGATVYATRLLRSIPNVHAAFGGYFNDHDPPPTPASPACTRGHVPPWAVAPKP